MMAHRNRPVQIVCSHRSSPVAWAITLVAATASWALAARPDVTPIAPTPGTLSPIAVAPAPGTILPIPGALSDAQPPPPNEYRLDGSGTWQPTAAPEPGTDAAVIANARKALAEDRPAAAQSILDDWIDANKRGSSRLLPQAYFIRADAISAGGNEFQALYDYEAVIRNFPQSSEYPISVERELDIAVKYVNGLERKFLGYRIIDASDIGEELLIRCQERLPGSRVAERAGIELADFYYRSREMELASQAYELFVRNYPQSAYVSKALQRRIYANIASFKGPRYNGKPLVDAAVLIEQFRTKYPAKAAEAGLDEALLTRIDESGGQQMLVTANWYLTKNDLVSARYTLQRLLARFPRTGAATEAADIMNARAWAMALPKPEKTPVLERKPVKDAADTNAPAEKK